MTDPSHPDQPPPTERTPPAGPRVGIVVITYSPGETLDAFLDSLPAATTSPPFVVMADNGSTDGSVERAAERPDAPTLLRTGGNIGFGSAGNAGAAVLPDSVEYLVIANPDLRFGARSLDLLVEVADQHPDAALFGPAIRTPDGKLYPSARRLPSITDGIGHAMVGWLWPRNPWTRRYRAEDDQVALREAGWLSGACLLIRRAAFEQIGGFDERYFMYFEDVDLADRMHGAGWRTLYAPQAQVEHVGGHSTSRHQHRMLTEHHRSAYRYLADRHPARWQGPLRLVLKAGLAARTFVATRSERVAAGAEIQGEPEL
ncbi:MAG: glycosyltransferase family 2 protein [Nakamurella sp.]